MRMGTRGPCGGPRQISCPVAVSGVTGEPNIQKHTMPGTDRRGEDNRPDRSSGELVGDCHATAYLAIFTSRKFYMNEARGDRLHSSPKQPYVNNSHHGCQGAKLLIFHSR